MTAIRGALERIGQAVLLFLQSLRYLPSAPRNMGRIIEQCLFMGYATVPLVVILSFSIGAVLALQIGFAFQNFGVNEYIGSVVGLAMVRELGPVMTAIMVVGRVGSATTAELGSMKIYREIDALNTMNIPPARLLVMPRMVAIALVMPLLTALSFVSGWAGGAIVVEAVSWIGLDYRIYFETLTDSVTVASVTDGLLKGEIFGVSVVLICASIGLNTTGGPRQIGEAVTKAVVASIIYILITDYFITDALL